MFGKKQGEYVGFNPFSKQKKQKPGVTSQIINKITQLFRGKLNPSSCISREIVQYQTIVVPTNFEIVGAQTIEQDSIQICKSLSSQQQKRNKFTSFNEYLVEEEQEKKELIQQEPKNKHQQKEQKLASKEKQLKSSFDHVLPDDFESVDYQEPKKERMRGRKASSQLYKKRKLNEKQKQVAIKFTHKVKLMDQLQDSINESGIQVVQEMASDDSLKNSSLLVGGLKEISKDKEEIIALNQEEGKQQQIEPPILSVNEIVESHSKGLKKSQSMINLMDDDMKSFSCSPKKFETQQSRKQSDALSKGKNENQNLEVTKEKNEIPQEDNERQQPKLLINFLVTGGESKKEQIPEKPKPTENQERVVSNLSNVSDTPLFGFGKNIENSSVVIQSKAIKEGVALFSNFEKKEQNQQQSSDQSSGQELQSNLFTFCQNQPKVSSENQESLNQPLTSDTSSSAPQQQQQTEAKPQEPESQQESSLFNQNEQLQFKQGKESLFATLIPSKPQPSESSQQGEQGTSLLPQTLNPYLVQKNPEQFNPTQVEGAKKSNPLFGDLLARNNIFLSNNQPKEQEKQQNSFQSNLDQQKQESALPKEVIKEKAEKQINRLFTAVEELKSQQTQEEPPKIEKPPPFSFMQNKKQENSQKPETQGLGLFGNIIADQMVTQTQVQTAKEQQKQKEFQNIFPPKLISQEQNNITEQKATIFPFLSTNQSSGNGLFNFQPKLETPKPQENPKGPEQQKQELKTPSINSIGLNCQWKSSDEQQKSQLSEQQQQKEEQKQSPFGFLQKSFSNNDSKSAQLSSDPSQKQLAQTPAKPIENPFLQQSPKIDQEQIKSYFSQQSSSSQAMITKPFPQTTNPPDEDLFKLQSNTLSMFNTRQPQQQQQVPMFQQNQQIQNTSIMFPSQSQNQFSQQQLLQQQPSQNQFQQYGVNFQQQQDTGMANEMEIVEPQNQSIYQAQPCQARNIFNQQPLQQPQVPLFQQQQPFVMQQQQQPQQQQLFGNTQQLYQYSAQPNDLINQLAQQPQFQQQQSQSKQISMLGLFSLDGPKGQMQQPASLNSSFTSKNKNKKQRIG